MKKKQGTQMLMQSYRLDPVYAPSTGILVFCRFLTTWGGFSPMTKGGERDSKKDGVSFLLYIPITARDNITLVHT